MSNSVDPLRTQSALPTRLKVTSRRRWFQIIAAGGSVLATGALSLAGISMSRRGRQMLGIPTWNDLYSATRDSFTSSFGKLTESEQRLLSHCHLDPESAVYAIIDDNRYVAWSARVMQTHPMRGYSMIPHRQSMWYRGRVPHQATLPASFLLPDDAKVRQLAASAGWDAIPESHERYNREGFRSDEYNPESDVQILAIGDSFIHGMRLPQAETIPAHMEHLLSSRFPSTQIQVTNAGVVGYGLRQYFSTLQDCYDHCGYRPHIVVANIYVNDIGRSRESVFGGGGDWQNVRHWLDQLKGYCRARNMMFALAIIPDKTQMTRRGSSTRHYQAKLSEVSGLAATRIFDPLDSFSAANRLQALSTNQPFCDPQDPFYLKSDHHFSPLGSRSYGFLCSVHLQSMITRMINQI